MFQRVTEQEKTTIPLLPVDDSDDECVLGVTSSLGCVGCWLRASSYRARSSTQSSSPPSNICVLVESVSTVRARSNNSMMERFRDMKVMLLLLLLSSWLNRAENRKGSSKNCYLVTHTGEKWPQLLPKRMLKNNCLHKDRVNVKVNKSLLCNLLLILNTSLKKWQHNFHEHPLPVCAYIWCWAYQSVAVNRALIWGDVWRLSSAQQQG